MVLVSPAHERTRILLVPDEVLAALDSRFLQRRNLTLRSALSPGHALALVASWRPQLVVFRNQLEAVAAAEFCRTLLAEAAPHGSKLLMITEALHDMDLGELLSIGADAHLVSPVESAQLLATISELLALERQAISRAALDALVHTEGFEPEGTSVDATLSSALQVSEDGMLIESNRQLALDARGRLHFFLPGVSERLSVQARVRAALDELRLRYALEFADLAPQHRAAIRGYVASRRAAA